MRTFMQPMAVQRTRLPFLVAVLAVTALVGCGGDDDDDATVDSTTTTTADAPATTGSTIAEEPVSTPEILAKLVVQVDEQFRPARVMASPCLHGPYETCVGDALEAYRKLDDFAGALPNLLRAATDPADQMYSGRADEAVVPLIDQSNNVGANAASKAEAAQLACLPDFGAGCDDANAALDAALDEYQLTLNAWRDHL